MPSLDAEGAAATESYDAGAEPVDTMWVADHTNLRTRLRNNWINIEETRRVFTRRGSEQRQIETV